MSEEEIEIERRALNKELHDDIKAIKKVLLGNGSIGLYAKVNILWAGAIFIASGLTITLGAFIWELIKN